MKKNGIMFMPHGNLQYSQLPINKRSWVIKQSYEKIFDLAEKLDIKIAFEASGQTLEIMNEQCPQVLVKLKNLIKSGNIEGVASPQTHIMLANIDPEIGYYSLVEGLDTWEKLTGVRPVTGWNPECSYASFIPEIYKKAGFKTLIADADSYLLGAINGLRKQTGLKFDVRGHSNKNELFKIEKAIQDNADALNALTKVNKLENGLNVILRSDMMCNYMLWYLMGATEGNRVSPVSIEEISEMLDRWKGKLSENSFIMPYAEDAEYCGTTAYFYVKQFGQARFFESAPDSVKKFEEILLLAKSKSFDFITPSQAVNEYEVINGKNFLNIENGCAWHGGTSKAWANTVYSRILDPVCKSVFDGIKAVCDYLKINIFDNEKTREILKTLTIAYVSDSRWPPAPTSPGRFNVQEAINALILANEKLNAFMIENGIGEFKSLYSHNIMSSEIAAISDELMSMKYFEENK